MQFTFEPFEHQRTEWDISREEEMRAILWEQGTGKTKLTIDTAQWLYRQGLIDAVFVVAPNGVHTNWISKELPAHMPSDVPVQPFCYHSGKAGTKLHQAGQKLCLETPGLAFLAMSYNAFMTTKGKPYAKKFLEKRRCLFVLDEAHYIKAPSAKRTKTLLAASKYAPYRRVLTGTPVANGPLDVYTIMKFLQADFWHPHGFSAYAAFKHYFGVWRKATSGENGREYEYCVGYRNVDELNGILAPHVSRVTKEDALDLPPKLYSYRYFELTAEQEKMYEQIKEEFMLWLDSGELVTAQLAIVRLLRLQQITCGYLPVDPDEGVWHSFKTNPRLNALKDVCEGVAGKAIIWARFRRDIDSICEALGESAVRYDGGTSTEDRADAIERFQNGDAKWFVANPAAAGTGLTLHAATTVIYYSNSFKLTDRLQSEDRAHRIGQEHPVSYIDIVAPGSIDERITEALLKKNDIAQSVLGDEGREWLTSM
jgi:SNF2 family DNA or RNA helicase